MIKTDYIKISVRAWSESISCKPLARQLGAQVYDKGELINGRRRSRDNYLTTEATGTMPCALPRLRRDYCRVRAFPAKVATVLRFGNATKQRLEKPMF
jgi:hypothetical protein